MSFIQRVLVKISLYLSPSPLPQLLEWIQRTMPWLNDRSPEKNLTEAQEKLEEFRQYGTATKPPKSDEKAKLEAHFHTLQVGSCFLFQIL